MKPTTVHLHPSFTVSQVDPRIFGGFLEHLGRAVYQGVYDPGSKHADEEGLRTDVLEALKKLKFTAMRYPGGNFVSGYDWIDGVGPKENRPAKLDLAWQTLDRNQFGTNEFMRLARKMDWTPMFAVNLGTGAPVEARNWLEYCNGKDRSYYADLRREHGVEAPHNIKLWCLGNEMDGPWQIGHVPAEHYAVKAQQTARMMKMFDPEVELVLCGSCTTGLPTYLEWDRKALEHCYQDVDYISLHRYVGCPDGDTQDFLAVGVSIDQQIEEMAGVCAYVKGRSRSKRSVHLSFDEWNVWYRANSGSHVDGRGQEFPHLIEEVYNLEDALVAAQFLNSFVRHADVVKIANLAQIVNVIAPILTEGDEMLIQSIYHPIEMFARRQEGTSLRVAVEGPAVESKSHAGAKQIDASAILNGRDLSVFLVNRSASEASEVTIEAGQARIASIASAEIVTGTDPKAANEFGREPVVFSAPYAGGCVQEGRFTAELPPMSFVAATLRLA